MATWQIFAANTAKGMTLLNKVGDGIPRGFDDATFQLLTPSRTAWIVPNDR